MLLLLVVSGAVAGALTTYYSPRSAFAAPSITTSSDTFYGSALVRVEIIDDSITTGSPTITPRVEANNQESSIIVSPISVNPGKYEFFITTAERALTPASPTFTSGSVSVGASTQAGTGGDLDQAGGSTSHTVTGVTITGTSGSHGVLVITQRLTFASPGPTGILSASVATHAATTTTNLVIPGSSTGVELRGSGTIYDLIYYIPFSLTGAVNDGAIATAPIVTISGYTNDPSGATDITVSNSAVSPAMRNSAAHVVRINQGSVTPDATDVKLSTTLLEGAIVRIKYGNIADKVLIFQPTLASLTSDKTTAGSDHSIILTLRDRDANVDPTIADTIDAGNANILTQTGLAGTEGAKFTEQGISTGEFRLTVTVGGTTGVRIASPVIGTTFTFTVQDHDVYSAAPGATSSFNTQKLSSPLNPVSVSIQLRNSDGQIELPGDPRFADGLKITVTDSDRNIRTDVKDIIHSVALGAQTNNLGVDAGATTETFTVSAVSLRTSGAITTARTITITTDVTFSAPVTTAGTITGTSSIAASPSGTTFTLGTVIVADAATLSQTKRVTATITVTTTGAADVTMPTLTVQITSISPSGSTINSLATVSGSPSVTGNNLKVTVDAQTGTIAVPLIETNLNTGIFVPNLENSAVKVEFGIATSVGPSSITFARSQIVGNTKITAEYQDSTPSTGTTSSTKRASAVIAHSPGTLISLQSEIEQSAKFKLRLTDPDLNKDNTKTDSYSLVDGGTFGEFAPDTAGQGLAQLQMKIRGTNFETIGTVTIGFTETDPTTGLPASNTGVFETADISMNTINSALVASGSNPLKQGDKIEFVYTDRMEEPVITSTAAIVIRKPTVSITADRDSIPLPTSGTVAVKFTVIVQDSTVNTDPGSTERITLAAPTITKADGTALSTNIGGLSSTAKVLEESTSNSGIFVGTYSVLLGTASNIEMNNAKVTFTYRSSSENFDRTLSIPIKAHDGTISANKLEVKNGDTLTIIIEDQDLNLDVTKKEQASFTVQGKQNTNPLVPITDAEETGVNTGIFSKTLTIGEHVEVSDIANKLYSSVLEIRYTDTINSMLVSSVRQHEIPVLLGSGNVVITPNTVVPGSKLTVEIHDNDLNQDPQATETLSITTANNLFRITSDRKNAEVLPKSAQALLVEETGPNDGIFRFTLKLSPLASQSATPTFGPGGSTPTFGVLPGDVLSFVYNDLNTATGANIPVSRQARVQSFDPQLSISQTTVSPGNLISFTLGDPDANRDSDFRDFVTLRVSSDSDPFGFETTALETSAASGVFALNIRTSDSVVESDVIAVEIGDKVTIKYRDSFPADYYQRGRTVVDASHDFSLSIPIVAYPGFVESATPSIPEIVDNDGLVGVLAGQQIMLSSTIRNNLPKSLEFVVLIQVDDPDGVTVRLAVLQTTVAANGEVKLSGDFKPDAAGEYTVKVFVVTDLANPQALSNPSIARLTVG